MEVSWSGGLDYPMFVITVAAGGERSGCLIGFATQAGVDPARFIVCLSDKNHTHEDVPIVDGCPNWFAGRVLQRLDAGDHQAILLEPVEVGAGEPSQLSFHRANRVEPGHEP